MGWLGAELDCRAPSALWSVLADAECAPSGKVRRQCFMEAEDQQNLRVKRTLLV